MSKFIDPATQYCPAAEWFCPFCSLHVPDELITEEGSEVTLRCRKCKLSTIVSSNATAWKHETKPEAEGNKDVHTEHCCIYCGCKYNKSTDYQWQQSAIEGKDPELCCSVMSLIKSQTYPCHGDCNRHY